MILEGQKSTLVRRFGFDDGLVNRVLGAAASRRMDDADLYAEYVESETYALEDSVLKTATRHCSQGAGIRAIVGDRFGYAHSNDLDASTLLLAAKTARAISDQSGTLSLPVLAEGQARDLYPMTSSPLDGDVKSRVQMLDDIDRRARAADPRVKEVFATLSLEDKEVVVARLDGCVVTDRRPLCRLDVRVVVEDNTRRESGRSGGGGRFTFENFMVNYVGDENRWQFFVDDAVRKAIIALDARPAPAGVFPVVLGPGNPGVLLHEAIGHGLEGDFNRKGTSAFSGRVGTRVASSECTVVDDGTLPGRRGSLNVDDEGTPTNCNVLIEKGILRGYLHDRMSARLMGEKPTGNGRRQSYAHSPMPRMTNTFMLSGSKDPEEIIRSVDYGLYAASFGGGQVEITSGKFVFSANEAYLIENGKITAPVRGATLIGNGPDVLTKVHMVGNDLEQDHGSGTCGKGGTTGSQLVPVGIGLPTICVEEMTVGGTAT